MCGICGELRSNEPADVGAVAAMNATMGDRGPDSGMFGICVSTKVPAVGAICPYARASVGAVVTQAP